MFKVEDFYPELDHFEHGAILDDVDTPWAVLTRIGDYITSYLAEHEAGYVVRKVDGLRLFERTLGFSEVGFNVERFVEIAEDTRVEGTDILLKAGVILEPGAMLKGLAIIGAGSEVRQGAYLRGNVICGERCTLGHTTEIKNSILMNHTEAGHFAYVGDSVLGSYVNLGAGTKLANLQLRKAAEKKVEAFPHIRLKLDGEVVNTGTAKIGVIAGDYAELGCNSVTAPAVFLGAHSWVMANTTVVKGFYPPRTVLK